MENNDQYLQAHLEEIEQFAPVEQSKPFKFDASTMGNESNDLDFLFED